MRFQSLRIPLLFLVVFILGFNVVSAQKKFKGTITISNDLPNALNATFTIKNELNMFEAYSPLMGEMKMVNNTKTGEKTTVTTQEGETIIIQKNSNDMQYRNLNKKYEKRRPNINNVTVKVTRETKKINGYKCYKVTAKDKKFEGEAWITKKFEIDPFDLFPITKIQQRAMPRIAKAMQNSMEGFMMEMTIKNTKTKEVNKMSVEIDKSEVDDEVFVVDTEGVEVYNEEKIRELMKNAKGNPDQMKKARVLMAQIRMQ